MYIYTHIYIYVCIHIYICIYIYLHIHIYILTCYAYRRQTYVRYKSINPHTSCNVHTQMPLGAVVDPNRSCFFFKTAYLHPMQDLRTRQQDWAVSQVHQQQTWAVLVLLLCFIERVSVCCS